MSGPPFFLPWRQRLVAVVGVVDPRNVRLQRVSLALVDFDAALAEMAVAAAVEEVDHQADRGPAGQHQHRL